MSSVIGNLHAVLGLDSTAFQKGMGDAGSSMRGLEAMAGNVQRSMAGLQATMQRAGAIFGALGLAVGIRGLADMADTWSDLQSRVGLAVGSMDKAGAVMQRLSDVADRTYSSIGQTTEGFLQNATTLRDLGLSTAQALDYTEALNNAMVVSGAKGDQATRVQTALSNAMALGALRGDNLNTILTAGGRVSELLAEELGVTTLQLRKLGTEGKITADVILRALVGNMEKLREEADDMPATIGDGFIRIGNAMQRLIGTWDQLFGASEMVSGALVYIAENFDMIANGAMIAGGVILGSYVPALSAVVAGQLAVIASNPYLLAAVAIGAASAALIKFGNDIKVIEGQFGSLNDYIVSAFNSIKDVVTNRMADLGAKLSSVFSKVTEGVDAIGLSWDDIVGFIKGAVNRIIGFVRAVSRITSAIFTGLPKAIAGGIVAVMQLMVDLVEKGLNKVVKGINTVIEGLQSIPGLGRQIGDTFGDLDFGDIPNPYKDAASELGGEITSGHLDFSLFSAVQGRFGGLKPAGSGLLECSAA